MFRRSKPKPPEAAETGQALTLYLVRHAEPRAVSHDLAEDPPLTARGRRQALALSRRLVREPFDHIYLSDLTRAFRTGEPVLRQCPDIPMTVTPLLREVSHHLCVAPDPALTAPEAALIENEKQNVAVFARHICEQHRPGERLLIFAHGNFIRSFLPRLAGMDPDPRLLFDVHHASVTIVDRWLSGRVVLRLVNCVCHLKQGDRS